MSGVPDTGKFESIQTRIADMYHLVDSADVIVGIGDRITVDIDSRIAPSRREAFLEKWIPSPTNGLRAEDFPEKSLTELIRLSQHMDFDLKIYSPLLTHITEGMEYLEQYSKLPLTMYSNGAKCLVKIAEIREDAIAGITKVIEDAGKNVERYNDELTHHRLNRRKDVFQVLMYQIIDDSRTLEAEIREFLKDKASRRLKGGGMYSGEGGQRSSGARR